MSMTSEQAKKTGRTNKKKYGADYYSRIGKLGAAARKKPYYHFQTLRNSDPAALKTIAAKGGQSTKRKKTTA